MVCIPFVDHTRISSRFSGCSSSHCWFATITGPDQINHSHCLFIALECPTGERSRSRRVQVCKKVMKNLYFPRSYEIQLTLITRFCNKYGVLLMCGLIWGDQIKQLLITYNCFMVESVKEFVAGCEYNKMRFQQSKFWSNIAAFKMRLLTIISSSTFFKWIISY